MNWTEASKAGIWIGEYNGWRVTRILDKVDNYDKRYYHYVALRIERTLADGECTRITGQEWDKVKATIDKQQVKTLF